LLTGGSYPDTLSLGNGKDYDQSIKHDTFGQVVFYQNFFASDNQGVFENRVPNLWMRQSDPYDTEDTKAGRRLTGFFLHGNCIVLVLYDILIK
jgi:hypothetical protein